jgi:hypothetical protein
VYMYAKQSTQKVAGPFLWLASIRVRVFRYVWTLSRLAMVKLHDQASFNANAELLQPPSAPQRANPGFSAAEPMSHAGVPTARPGPGLALAGPEAWFLHRAPHVSPPSAVKRVAKPREGIWPSACALAEGS